MYEGVHVPADDPDERQEQDAGAHQQLKYQVEHSGTAPLHLPRRVCRSGQLRSQTQEPVGQMGPLPHHIFEPVANSVNCVHHF